LFNIVFIRLQSIKTKILEIVHLLVYIDQLFDQFYHNFESNKSVEDFYESNDKKNQFDTSELPKNIFQNLSIDKLKNLNILLYKIQETLEMLLKKMEVFRRPKMDDKMGSFSFSIIESYNIKLTILKFAFERVFKLKRLAVEKNQINEKYEINKINNSTQTKIEKCKIKNEILKDVKNSEISCQFSKILKLEFNHLDESMNSNFNLTSTPRFCKEKEVMKNLNSFSNSNSQIFEFSFSENENELNHNSSLFSKTAQNSINESKLTDDKLVQTDETCFFSDLIIETLNLRKSIECVLRESKSTFKNDKKFRSKDSGIMSSSGRVSNCDGIKCNELATNLTLISDFNSTSYSTPPLFISYDNQENLALKHTSSYKRLSKSLPNMNEFNSIEERNNNKKDIEFLEQSRYNIDERSNTMFMAKQLICQNYENININRSVMNHSIIEKINHNKKTNHKKSCFHIKENMINKLINKIFKLTSRRFFYYGNFFIFILISCFFIFLPVILPTCCDFEKQFLIFNEKKYDNNYLPF
jgi:hypothetical protein